MSLHRISLMVHDQDHIGQDFEASNLKSAPKAASPRPAAIFSLEIAAAVVAVTMAGSVLAGLLGFAFAITTAGLLTGLLGPATARPLVAVLSLTNQVTEPSLSTLSSRAETSNPIPLAHEAPDRDFCEVKSHTLHEITAHTNKTLIQ